MVGRAERDIELLEKDLEELRRRNEEISQLLQTEDNAHFLQVNVNYFGTVNAKSTISHFIVEIQHTAREHNIKIYIMKRQNNKRVVLYYKYILQRLNLYLLTVVICTQIFSCLISTN